MFARRAAYDATTPQPFAEISIDGRVLLADGSEHACYVRFQTAETATVVAAADPKVLEQATFRLDGIGSMTAVVTEVGRAGFSIRLDVGNERSKRIGARLEWLRAQAGGAKERRAEARIVPLQRSVAVTLPDGSSHVASIVDLSRSGVSLVLGARPEAGTRILVGRRYADVVRTTADGVAVAFKLPLRDSSFDENVVL